MNERDLIKRRLYIFLSVFVVVTMTSMTMAGAVQQDLSQIGGIGQVTVPTLDEPGDMDTGNGVGLFDDNAFVEGTETGVGATDFNEIELSSGIVDPDEQKRLADKILGEGVTTEGQSPDEIRLQTSQYDLNSYNELLFSLVNNFIGNPTQNNGETLATDPDSSYTNNLYNSVSEYLTNNVEDTYVPAWRDMASDGYTPEREDVSSRTIDTKVFSNDDGTYTAILNQGAIHYKDENGAWQDVDLTLRTSSQGGYEVVKNNIKSYFADDSSALTVDVDGNSWLKWTPTAQVYVDPNGLSHSLSEAQDSVGKVNGNMITYENTFTDTTEEFQVTSSNVKHNLILGSMPDSAIRGNYLSYVGKVELADGLSLYIEGNPVSTNMETRGAIEVRNLYGEIVYVLPPPVIYELEDQMEMVEGSYSIEITEDGIYLSMNTPIDWLVDADRQFPVVVDPNVYVTLDVNQRGYVYHRSDFYDYVSSPPADYTNHYYYFYYTPTYDVYYPYIGTIGYKYTYTNPDRSLIRDYTRRAWFEWDTSAIPDTNTIKQIDFHGTGWRVYSMNTAYPMTVNIRDAAKDVNNYDRYDTTAKKKEFFDSMTAGSLYNGSVDFGTTYNSDVDVYALGGKAVANMQARLAKNDFQMTMERTNEMPQTRPGYGYFYPSRDATSSQLYVTYDPCPTAPIVDTGGPYMIPEGAGSVKLDASGSVVCGSSVFYKWDTDADGLYDLVSTTPQVTWAKSFPDDAGPMKLTLLIEDKTNTLSSKATTTLTVFNVNPKFGTMPPTITGTEGQTLIIPKIEFTDPGADTWTYEYDLDGDSKPDKSGSTITSGGKYYVPSVSWLFCDNVDGVDLTVEDDDGGFSDDVEQEELDAEYDVAVRTYKRPTMSSRPDAYYKYMYYTSSSSTRTLRSYTSLTSWDYDYRPLFKYDVSKLPSSFTPTNVSVTSRLSSVSYNGGKMGVVGLSADPNTGSNQNVWNDASSANIMDTGTHVLITTAMAYNYFTVYLDPKDFVTETNKHSNWYGVAYNTYEKKPISGTTTYHLYTYVYGGSYNTLTLTDGTTTYRMVCYTNNAANLNGMNGYTYKRSWPARDVMYRQDDYSYLYVEKYSNPSYNSVQESRSVVKFGAPSADPSKVVGADMEIYFQYAYTSAPRLKVGVVDIGSDPETATDLALFNDMASSNIHKIGYTSIAYWEPGLTTNLYYTIPLDDQDYVDKMKANSDWYAVGLNKYDPVYSGSQYMYFRAIEYSSGNYKAHLFVDFRVPVKIPVVVTNVDPKLDASKMVISPSTVNEGDNVKVSGITYTDPGCDEHYYRVSIPVKGDDDILVVDWTEAKDGKLEFEFMAPDDDPEDADLDISKDKISFLIEFKDDDFYIPKGDFLIVPNSATTPTGGGNVIPWQPSFQNQRRYQQYYGKSQLGSTPRDIIGWGFRYYSSTGTFSATYVNLKVIASHKTTVGLSSTFDNNHGAGKTTVLSKSSFTWSKTAPGQPWVTMAFDTPFKYNGIDNIVMEVSYWDGSTNTGTVAFNTASTADLWRLYAYGSPTNPTGTVGSSYGLVTQFEFAKSTGPIPKIQTATFDLIIHNVEPVLDMSGVKLILENGTETSTVPEGETFKLTNVTFKDPGAQFETEVFEYRIDYGGGVTSPWTVFDASAGNDVVVPNENRVTPGNNGLYPPFDTTWSSLATTGTRFQQLCPVDQMGGLPKQILSMSWRPWPGIASSWTRTYNDLKVYMMHTSGTTLSTTFASNYGTDRTLVFSRSSFTWGADGGHFEFMPMVFDTAFNYNGASSVVYEVSYATGSATGHSDGGAMDIRYRDYPGMHIVYATTASATVAPNDRPNSGLIVKFDFPPNDYYVIPPVELMFPDDHPTTGTASDDFTIGIEIRDDDGGSDSDTVDVTVENVAPTIELGRVYVDGAEVSLTDKIVVPNYATTVGANSNNVIPWRPSFPYQRYMNWYDKSQFAGGGMINSLSFRSDNDFYTNVWKTSYNNLLVYMMTTTATTLSTTFANNFGTDRTLVYSGPLSFDNDGTSEKWHEIPLNTWFNYDGTSNVIVEISHTGGTESGTNPGIMDAASGTTSFMHRLYGSLQSSLTGSVSSNYGLTTGFGFEKDADIEMDEGQFLELENFDIIDPAEGEPTETMHFQVDWGDGEMGVYANTTLEGGIQLDPVGGSGDFIQVPNVIAPYWGGNTIPWGPSFPSHRYQQFYGSKQLGGSKAEITSLSFYYNYVTPWSVSYNNLKIYLSHKSSYGLSSTFLNNYGTDRTLVFAANSYTWSKTTATPEWKTIDLDTNFKYNGNDHIVMEVVYPSGTPQRLYFNRDSGGNDVQRLWAALDTATSGSLGTYGLYTQFGLKPSTPSAKEYDWQSYSHRYRDDPCDGDIYTLRIHAYDDDLGHGTRDLTVKVNNVAPSIDPNYVMPQIIGFESGTPSIILPKIPFEDPGTQIPATDACDEDWTVWWDIDNNGLMNNAPDVIATVPSSLVTEVNNRSIGQTPELLAYVNDDYVRRPIAVYLFDEDMTLGLASNPESSKGTMTVSNVAPTATLEVYVPMEVRVRMSGTRENDVRVRITQTNPQDPKDVLMDEMTIERVPGQPKENPFSDGSPSAPLLVKVQPSRIINVVVTHDATADSNDVHTNSGPNGADPTYVYLDFPREADYDPAEETQSSSQGHHWIGEYKYNVQQDGPTHTETTDVSKVLMNKKATLVGRSDDDSSDDAQFNYQILSGSAPMPYTQITYYNDDSTPQVGGPFKDLYPSPWDGTAPCHFEDVHEFVYTSGFSIALYIVDDDGGRSKTVILTLV